MKNIYIVEVYVRQWYAPGCYLAEAESEEQAIDLVDAGLRKLYVNLDPTYSAEPLAFENGIYEIK